MEPFPSTLPPVEIDANGVVSTRTAFAPPPTVAVEAPAPAAKKPLPQSLSSDMLSVLLQVQGGRAV